VPAATAAAVPAPARSAAPLQALTTGASRAAVAENPRPPLPTSADVLPTVGHEDEGVAGEFFRGKFIWHAAAWLSTLVCLAIVGAAASLLPNPPKGQLTGIYGCLGLFGVLSLVAGYVGFRLAGQKYAVFSDRLVEWQCFRPTEYRWDQIREIYQDVHPMWTTFRVVTSLGREFIIRGEVVNHKRLGEIISERLTERLLPTALAEIEAGRDVRLGPLRISGAGVMIDGQFEPWHRIGIPTFGLDPTVKRETNRVSRMIHVNIGSTRVELGKIPNYGIFQALACHLSFNA
jgi:hypothetical protein